MEGIPVHYNQLADEEECSAEYTLCILTSHWPRLSSIAEFDDNLNR
jgi:hypothetical protein